MIVAIHQPEHMPWLGFFDKARRCETFVLLDDVQFRKNYFQNRNRIKSAAGELWLTVPVLTKGKHEQRINEVEINNEGSPRWKEKSFGGLAQNYGRARFWKEHEAFFRNVFEKTWDRLVDLNEAIIRYLLEALSIQVTIVRASSLECEGGRGEHLLNLCRKLQAGSYLSGISGRDYLDIEQFHQNGIDVLFQEFHHPIYKQLHGPFMPCLSVVDLLFNYGADSLSVIKGEGVDTLSEVFT